MDPPDAFEAKKRMHVAIIALASGAYSTAILNRWVVTRLGLKSFGRVWQYFVSWGELGFVRRGLVGTLLTATGANRLIADEYALSYVVYAASLVGLYALVFAITARAPRLRGDRWLAMIVFWSPATFTHLAYSTGNLDLTLVFVFGVALFAWRGALGVSALTIAGILVHESFMFLVPLLLLVNWLRTEQGPARTRVLIVSGVSAVVALAVVVAYGRLRMGRSAFELLMAAHLPAAAFNHPLWSGYLEVAGPGVQNPTEWLRSLADHALYAAIPTAYALLVATIAATGLKAKLIMRVLVFAAITFPLAAIFVASDYYRWTSLSALGGIFAIVALVSANRCDVSYRNKVLVGLFCVFAPFGGADFARPFPMHEFLMERLVRLVQNGVT